LSLEAVVKVQRRALAACDLWF